MAHGFYKAMLLVLGVGSLGYLAGYHDGRRSADADQSTQAVQAPVVQGSTIEAEFENFSVYQDKNQVLIKDKTPDILYHKSLEGKGEALTFGAIEITLYDADGNLEVDRILNLQEVPGVSYERKDIQKKDLELMFTVADGLYKDTMEKRISPILEKFSDKLPALYSK